jgi:hypothetical protein
METFLSTVYQDFEFPPYVALNSYKYNANFQSDFGYNDNLTIATDANGVQTFSGTGTGVGTLNGSADWSEYSTAKTFSGSSLGLIITSADARNKFSGGWTQNYASNTLIPTGQDTANITTQDTGDDIPGGGTTTRDYTFTATPYPIPDSIWAGLFGLFSYGPDCNDNFYLPGISFNTGGSTTLGVIGTPTVVGSVQSLSVTATTRIAPEQTFTQSPLVTGIVWTGRGVSVVCFAWAGALAYAGYAAATIGEGLIISAGTVINAGISAYGATASAVTAVVALVNNVGCFRAGTPVLAAAGLQPIETIQLGRRVITSKGDDSGRSIDPETTRLIRLSFVKDGQEFLMSFLRPASVVEGLSAGDTMDISVMELEVRGSARVLAIEPCPPIEDGPGSVVTGAFNSETVDLYKLKVQGLDEPIEVTGNHPIFSEDRHDFVPTSSLSGGEQLRTRIGTAMVESVERKYGQWTVYNLEVDEAHRYYVTEKTILVHNICLPTFDELNDPADTWKAALDLFRQLSANGDPGNVLPRLVDLMDQFEEFYGPQSYE